MHVLVANIPLPQNRFLVDLNAALARNADIVHDHEAFWNCQGEFNIVHLHFPEYLTYEMEGAYRAGLSDALIAEVEERLQHWSNKSTLVITRHVLLPHDARSNPRWEKLYEMVYRYVHGVVHFAEPSVEEFKSRYAQVEFVHGQPQHCVIPHHNYASLPNQVSRKAARARLDIAQDANVLLVFGAIRSDAERELVMHSFRGLRVPRKVLLVSRWRETLANVSWIRLKYWLRDLKRLYYRLHPQYRFNYGFVKEEDTQLYLNAADVLLIPRSHVLNSGNVTLGMTFGKVVVGPDSLDVGYLLGTTGNVVFDPDHPETVTAAVAHGFKLAEENQVGPANRQLALSEWSSETCADHYFRFFSKLSTEKANT